MTLRQKQSLFVQLLTRLLVHLEDAGYEVTLGEAWRSPEEAARLAKANKGIVKSLHCDRLAIDLNLFRKGIYLRRTDDYAPMGEWWELQHPLCRWGGRFGDGNHFSMEHGGRK